MKEKIVKESMPEGIFDELTVEMGIREAIEKTAKAIFDDLDIVIPKHDRFYNRLKKKWVEK